MSIPIAASISGSLAAASPAPMLHTIADFKLWAITVAGVLILLGFDFIITHRPHEVGLREAVHWTLFYLALPLLFGVWVWLSHGHKTGLEYYTGYIVEKSLSVDNLFIFILILSAFAVPRRLQQRVLLFGIAGALVMRAIFIALGAALISEFAWMFLIFGAILLFTAWGVFKDARSDEEETMDVHQLRVVRIAQRIFPVSDEYHEGRFTTVVNKRRMITPFALVTLAILSADVVFAVDSVPAVFGITGDPYLVFVTNAFALLGLRALYFVLQGLLSKLRYLGYGLAVILVFIGVKLILHWAHGVWPSVPTVPTLLSLGVIVVALTITTITSLSADKRDPKPTAIEGGADQLTTGKSQP